MLTIDALRQYGADVDEGLGRCMGKEDFYIKLVNMAINDNSISRLEEALKSGDLDTAFDVAHSLKGVLGNLALTPLCTPVTELTELLRHKEDADYEKYMDIIREEYNRLVALAS